MGKSFCAAGVFLSMAISCFALGLPAPRQSDRFTIPRTPSVNLDLAGISVRLDRGPAGEIVIENEEMVSPSGFMVEIDGDGTFKVDVERWRSKRHFSGVPELRVRVPKATRIRVLASADLRADWGTIEWAVADERIEIRGAGLSEGARLSAREIVIRDTEIPGLVRMRGGSVEVRDSGCPGSRIELDGPEGLSALVRHVRGRRLELSFPDLRDQAHVLDHVRLDTLTISAGSGGEIDLRHCRIGRVENGSRLEVSEAGK